jgi:hypothetical protein
MKSLDLFVIEISAWWHLYLRFNQDRIITVEYISTVLYNEKHDFNIQRAI